MFIRKCQLKLKKLQINNLRNAHHPLIVCSTHNQRIMMMQSYSFHLFQKISFRLSPKKAHFVNQQTNLP
jgi:hypothetical protein